MGRKGGLTGSYHTCVRLDNNKIKCWGRGSHGQLGQGSTSDVGKAPNTMGERPKPIPYTQTLISLRLRPCLRSLFSGLLFLLDCVFEILRRKFVLARWCPDAVSMACSLQFTAILWADAVISGAQHVSFGLVLLDAHPYLVEHCPYAPHPTSTFLRISLCFWDFIKFHSTFTQFLYFTHSVFFDSMFSHFVLPYRPCHWWQAARNWFGSKRHSSWSCCRTSSYLRSA